MSKFIFFQAKQNLVADTKSPQEKPADQSPENKPPKDFKPFAYPEWLWKAYPLDLKTAATQIFLGAMPTYNLTGYMIPPIKELGGMKFPKLEFFKFVTDDYCPKPFKWERYDPSWFLIRKNIISPMNLICYLGPITEEIMFRGFIMQGLSKKLEDAGMSKNTSRFTAIVANSVISSAMHVPRLRVGALLNGMFWSTLTTICDDSLIPSTTNHIINNRIAMSLALKK